MAASSTFFDPFTRVDVNWLTRLIQIERVRPDILRSLSTNPEFENIPVPRALLDGLRQSASIRDESAADVQATLAGITLPNIPLPDFPVPGIPGIPVPGIPFPDFPRPFPVPFPDGPIEPDFGNSGGGGGRFPGGFTLPRELIRTLDLAGFELVRNRKDLAQMMRSFGAALERGDVDGAMAQVSSRYYDRTGAVRDDFKKRLSAAVAIGKERRIVFTGARDVTAAGGSLGAVVTGAYEVDGEARSFAAEVIFEREGNDWKIASFDPA